MYRAHWKGCSVIHDGDPNIDPGSAPKLRLGPTTLRNDFTHLFVYCGHVTFVSY